jgi:hypothetical protein
VGALLLIAGSHASAQAPIYTGGGTVKCSQLVQDYDRNKQTEIVYWTWAQGYMSGINRVLDQSKAGTRDLTNAGTQANRRPSSRSAGRTPTASLSTRSTSCSWDCRRLHRRHSAGPIAAAFDSAC